MGHIISHYAATLSGNTLSMVLSPTSRFFLPYLAFTLLFALTICYRRAKCWRGAFRDLLPRAVFFHRSSLNDYKLAAINLVLLAALPAVGVIGLAVIASGTEEFFRHTLGPGPAWQPTLAALIVYNVALFLAYDGGNFLQHWLQHRIPLLWELHKVHHSAEVMTPITAIRVHPLSSLFSSLVLSVANGLVAGSFLYLFKGHVALYPLLGLNLFLMLQYTIGAYNLQHSHIWLSFPPVLRGILISPATHMIYHSSNPQHHDKNFAFVLTVWDWLFGTLYIPDDHEQYGLQLGLGEAEQSEMQTLTQLYLTPLRRIAPMLMSPRALRRSETS